MSGYFSVCLRISLLYAELYHGLGLTVTPKYNTMKKLLLILLLSLATSALSANIIITEILYNPAGGDVPEPGVFAYEWVEIHNSGSETVDLTGWMLRDEDGNSSNWGTLSGSLAPGGVGVITTSTSENFKASWSTAADAVIFTVPGWGSLANNVSAPGNEVTQIQDESGTPVDIADYLTVDPWPTTGGSESIYLLQGFMTPEANDDGANWAVATLGVDGAINPVAGPDNFNTNTIASPGVIPEPSTYAVIFLGLVGSAALIRRRRR